MKSEHWIHALLFLFLPFSSTELTCRNSSILRFEQNQKPKAQTLSSLSICTEHRYSTCCERSHTDSVVRKVAAYFQDDEFSHECRQFGLQVECSVCDSRINTGKLEGVCEDLCEQYFRACWGSFFRINKLKHLAPCEPESLVCYKLQDLVSNGKEFCEKSGHIVQKAPCYNGRPLPPPFTQRRTPSQMSEFEKWAENVMWKVNRLKWWQKVLFVGGFTLLFLICLHSLFHLIFMCCECCCAGTPAVPKTPEEVAREMKGSKRKNGKPTKKERLAMIKKMTEQAERLKQLQEEGAQESSWKMD